MFKQTYKNDNINYYKDILHKWIFLEVSIDKHITIISIKKKKKTND